MISEMLSRFVTFETLVSYGGCFAMVTAATQLLKEAPGIRKLPTQLLSYLLALVILYPATFFTSGLDAKSAVLVLFNGIIISLAANGGYAAAQRIGGQTDGQK